LKKNFYTIFFLLFVGAWLFSCKSYKYNIMFQVDEETDLSFISSALTVAEKSYLIQPNDLLEIKVYTNNGEQIIDPNYELRNQQNQNRMQDDKPAMLVLPDGSVRFPMIGIVKLEGMSIGDAEVYLGKKYSEFYKDAYVSLTYLNKRVIVLGAQGGQVIPLTNENMSVVEVIALAGGINLDGKAKDVRLIRGDLHNPQIFLIDLSTIDGMRTSMLSVVPGDIVYIQPTRKIVTEGAKDFLTVFSIAVNAITLYYLIVNINN
jgi:polysaccharide biosynthesis/export protein